MNSFQNPVTPPDPYDRFRVEPSERDSSKQQGYGGEPPDDKYSLFAQMLKTLYKMVTSFLGSSDKGGSKEGQIADSFRSLKAAFEILKKEDRSEDVQFLTHLSQLWLHVLEEGIQLTKNTEAGERFKELVKKIEHYPEQQTHSLGYYLSEYAGQKWIPFPYMELIQKIHAEHQKYPEISALTEWTRLIDDLLLKVG